MRERASAFAALLAHAAVLAMLATRDLPPPTPTVEIPIDAIEITDPSEVPITPTAVTETAGPGVAHHVAPRERPTPERSSEPAAVGSGEPTGTASIAIGPPPGGSAAPIALGIGGTKELNPFLVTHDDPPSEQPRDEKAAERSVKDALHAHDREIGLTPDGPVLSALRDAAYETTMPPTGRAVFVALVDKLGTVVELRVADGDANAGWRDVRERAVKTLASKKVTMRGAGPVELRIEIVSQVLLPSGSEHHVTPAASASKIEVPDNAKIGGGAGDVVQSWTIMTFDLSDIGATRRRVVHARVVSSRAL